MQVVDLALPLALDDFAECCGQPGLGGQAVHLAGPNQRDFDGPVCCFGPLAREEGVLAVMSRSAMARFLSSPQAERTACKVCRTRNDARADVADDIERICNPRRGPSKPGCLSPVEFGTGYMLA